MYPSHNTHTHTHTHTCTRLWEIHHLVTRDSIVDSLARSRAGTKQRATQKGGPDQDHSFEHTSPSRCRDEPRPLTLKISFACQIRYNPPKARPCRCQRETHSQNQGIHPTPVPFPHCQTSSFLHCHTGPLALSLSVIPHPFAFLIVSKPQTFSRS